MDFGKGRRPVKRIVERVAEAVDVGTAIDAAAVHHLFRGHVIRRSNRRLFTLGRLPRLLSLEGDSGQSQIEDLQHAVGVDQEIGRFDVAMDQAHRMGVSEPFGRLTDEIGRFAIIQRALFFDHAAKILSFDVLHHQIVDVFSVFDVLVEVVRANDMRMIELRDGKGLETKAVQQVGIGLVLAGQDLDGAAAAHHLVFGQEHPAHAPLAQRLEDAMGAEKEAAVLALQEIVGLPFGQDPAFDQFVGHGAGGLPAARLPR